MSEVYFWWKYTLYVTYNLLYTKCVREREREREREVLSCQTLIWIYIFFNDKRYPTRWNSMTSMSNTGNNLLEYGWVMGIDKGKKNSNVINTVHRIYNVYTAADKQTHWLLISVWRGLSIFEQMKKKECHYIYNIIICII